MKKKLLLTGIQLLLAAVVYAQIEKFDIASFTPPPGWQRIDSNGVLAFHAEHTVNNQLSFCQVILYPSKSSTNNTTKDFDNAWASLVAKFTGSKKKPKTTTEKTPDGWTAISGTEQVSKNGLTYTALLTSISGFGKVMNVQVNIAGTEYAASLENFFTGLELDKNAMPTNTSAGNNAGSNSYDDYIYTTPEKWVTQRGKDCIYLIHQEGNKQGCYISLFAPRISTGNLENDVRACFNEMYGGWQLINVGRDVLTKGYNQQGVEYCMMEGSMMKPRGEQYDYEEGGAIVFKTGNKAAIVTIRHESTGLYCKCKKDYDTWARFLNSFTVKNLTAAAPPQNPAEMVIGSWIVAQSATLSNYVFAANGHYQHFSGYGDYVQIDANTIGSRSSTFAGDGKYSIKGNTLTLVADSRKNQPDIRRIRFEKVNAGGKGWKDRIYIYTEKPIDGGKPFETCFERSVSK